MKHIVLSIVILATNMGRLKAQQPEWETISHPLFSSSNNIWCLEADEQNDVWVGTNQAGILKYSNGIWTEINSSNSALPDNTINDLSYQNNIMWVATATGVVKISGQSVEAYTNNNSPLSILSPSCIKADRAGNVWFGQNSCNGGELISIKNGIWQKYDYTNSLIPQQAWIRCLSIDPSNNIWVGTYSHGLFKFDGNSWYEFNTNNCGIPSDLVKSIGSLNDGTILVGTFGGVSAFDGINWTTLSSNQTNAIEVSLSGDAWIGFDVSGAGAFHYGDSQYYNINNSGLTSDFVFAITESGNGNVWFACYPTNLIRYGVNSTSTEIVDPSFDQQPAHIYPNPFDDRIIVETAGPDQFIWMNLLGDRLKVLYSRSGDNLIYDTSLLPDGIYFLMDVKKNQSFKLIKTH